MIYFLGLESLFSKIKGNGNVINEKRELPPFDVIYSSGIFDITVTCQEPQSLEIITDENILPLVITEVRESTLHISLDNKFGSDERIKINITVPDIRMIKLSGIDTLTMDNFNNEKLTADISGVGKLTLKGATQNLDSRISGTGKMIYLGRAENLTLDISGCGNFQTSGCEFRKANISLSGTGKAEISGAAETVTVNISGAGNINAPDFHVKNANISISGAGSADIAVSDLLTSKISGAGKIAYSGNPKVEKIISGAGRIFQKS
jgi:hypothetical protein